MCRAGEDPARGQALLSRAARHDAAPRAASLAPALAAILLLPVALAWGRMDLPFLDGRIHYNYDNAAFSFQARTGILLGGPRAQLGLTSVPFVSYRQPAGTPSYYTHHPFLFKAGLQLWMRVMGDGERTSRWFALAVSMLAAAGTLAALAVATGSVLAAALGAAVMVATPVFAVHEVCIKYEIEGMAVGAWVLAALFLALGRPTRARLAALSILAFLAPLAHWTSLFLSLALMAWMVGEWLIDRASVAGQAAIALAAGTGLGFVLLLATFAWLKGGWAPYWRDLVVAVAFRQDTSSLPPGAWGDAQRRYLDLNFTRFLPGIAAVAAAAQAILWVARRFSGAHPGRPPTRRALPAFFFATLATACLWQFGFRQSSYIHLFTQLWFVMPLAALVAATVRLAPRGIARHAATGAAGLLVIALSWTSLGVVRRVLAAQQGTVEDVRFLRSLREQSFRRLVYVPIVHEPPSHWFDGPIGPYYTSRSIVTYDGVMPIHDDDKILVPRDPDRGEVLARFESWAGVRLTRETCDAHLCAYDVRRR